MLMDDATPISMSEEDEQDDLYSDLFKDVYGFRPRADLQTWREMTPAQKEEQWNFLVAKLNEQQLEHQAAQKAAMVAFEERVLATMKLGAKDRNQALRWIYAAECSGWRTDYPDWDYLCFTLNLPYGYFKGLHHESD